MAVSPYRVTPTRIGNSSGLRLPALMEGIKERIAADPYASRFDLTGSLRRYGHPVLHLEGDVGQ